MNRMKLGRLIRLVDCIHGNSLWYHPRRLGKGYPGSPISLFLTTARESVLLSINISVKNVIIFEFKDLHFVKDLKIQT